jgi:hypothetical protein
MKHLSLLVCAVIFIGSALFSQTPQYIPYQAVARNAAGNLLANQNVSLRFTIHETSGAGTVDYQETQSATTNNLGLFSVNIGNGSVVTGSFAGIPWGNNVAKFTQVEIDPAGGTSYANMGAAQMMSVPYALYAGSASSIPLANPGGLIGMTVVNGSATTATRSDGTHAIDPAIVPTWTGTHTFSNSTYSGLFTGGNVGIGTTTPNFKLQVTGGAVATDNYFFSTTPGIGQIVLNSVGTYYGNLSNPANQIWALGYSTGGTALGTPVLTWAATGNVGIGVTSPSYKLHVSGGAIATDNYFFNVASGIGQVVLNSSGAYYGNIANPVAQVWALGYSAGGTALGTSVLSWGASGNVGIGTNAPLTNLHITGTATPAITVTSSNYATTYKTQLGTQGGAQGILVLGNNGVNEIRFGNTGVGGLGKIYVNNTVDYSTTTNGTLAMTFANNGYIGIGTASPNAPLDVEEVSATAGNATGTGYAGVNANTGAFSCNGCGGSWAYSNFSIIASARILVHGEVDVLSDRRIKNVEDISNAASDLETLKKLEVTDFNYKDKVEYGDMSKKGFIAQQVEGIFPEAITKRSDYIPNIYARAESAGYDAVTRLLTISLAKPHDLVKGDKVKLITAEGKKEVIVKDVLSENSFSAESDAAPSDWVFVFGKQVNDFRVVDYDRIYTLNVSATQELAKELAETQNLNKKLEGEIAALKANLDKVNEIHDLNTQHAEAGTTNSLQLLQKQLDELKALMDKNGIRSEK